MNFKKRAQLFPRNLLDKLGFERIREELRQLTGSELGKREVERLSIYADRPTISFLLNQVKEYSELLADHDTLDPDTGYPDVSESLERITKENTVLEFEELIQIRTFLQKWLQGTSMQKEFLSEFTLLGSWNILNSPTESKTIITHIIKFFKFIYFK